MLYKQQMTSTLEVLFGQWWPCQGDHHTSLACWSAPCSPEISGEVSNEFYCHYITLMIKAECREQECVWLLTDIYIKYISFVYCDKQTNKQKNNSKTDAQKHFLPGSSMVESRHDQTEYYLGPSTSVIYIEWSAVLKERSLHQENTFRCHCTYAVGEYHHSHIYNLYSDEIKQLETYLLSKVTKWNISVSFL